MNELLTLNDEILMESREVVKLINGFRNEEGNRATLTHANFLKSIDKEIETLENVGISTKVNFYPSSYSDGVRNYRCFNMTKSGIMQMLNKESALVRYKTQQYIEALEKEVSKPALPTTYKEALQQLLIQVEENERLEKEKNKAIEDKNRLIHQGKLYNTTEIAKELGFKSANALNKYLESIKVQYKTNGTWVLAAQYSEEGYVSIKQNELENGKIVYNRKWTGKGRDFLLELFDLK